MSTTPFVKLAPGPIPQTTYTLPFGVLDASHLVIRRTSDSSLMLSGWTLTPGLFPSLEFDVPLAGNVTVSRVTPTRRLVNFMPGSLSEADLDTSALQSLYLIAEQSARIEEIQEQITVNLNSNNFSWAMPGGANRVMLSFSPVAANWVTLPTLANSLGIEGAVGLTAPAASNTNSFLVSTGTAWTARTAAQVLGVLALGPWATVTTLPDPTVHAPLALAVNQPNAMVQLTSAGLIPQNLIPVTIPPTRRTSRLVLQLTVITGVSLPSPVTPIASYGNTVAAPNLGLPANGLNSYFLPAAPPSPPAAASGLEWGVSSHADGLLPIVFALAQLRDGSINLGPGTFRVKMRTPVIAPTYSLVARGHVFGIGPLPTGGSVTQSAVTSILPAAGVDSTILEHDAIVVVPANHTYRIACALLATTSVTLPNNNVIYQTRQALGQTLMHIEVSVL